VRARVARHVAAIDARIAARGAAREVAWGSAEDGEAFAHYAAACKELRRGPRVGWNGEFWRDGKKIDESTARELRARFATGLAHLVAGARCRDARPRCLDAYSFGIASAVMVEVALRLRDGDDLGGVRLWLDAFTFQLDVDRSQIQALSSQWRGEEPRRLDAAAAEVLSEGCRRLDQRLMEFVPLDETVVAWMRPVLDGDYTRDWGWRDMAASWRHGFEPDDRHLAEFAAWLDRGPKLAAFAPTGRAREAQWRATWPELATGSHLMAIGLDQAYEGEQERRAVVTELRMLRLALAWQHRQPLPDVVDPFTGEPFAMTRDGDIAMWISAEHQGSRRSATR
jgi:hypothetical protein